MSDDETQAAMETTEQTPADEPVWAPEPPSSSPPTSALAALEAALPRWIDGFVRNSPLANAESWNHLHGILPRLRELFLEELNRAR